MKVDAVDYFEVIENPIDLGAMRRKLDGGVYATISGTATAQILFSMCYSMHTYGHSESSRTPVVEMHAQQHRCHLQSKLGSQS